MVSFTLLAGLALAPLALALPRGATSSLPITSRDAPEDGMIWMGRASEGGGILTLYGQADSILEQLLSINPNYKPVPLTDEDVALIKQGNKEGKTRVSSKTPERPSPTGQVDRRSIQERGLQPGMDWMNCYPNVGTANKVDLSWVSSYVRSVGGYCLAPAYDCRRMGYKGSSAAYVCSEKNEQSGMFCADAANWVDSIRTDCCKGAGGIHGNAYQYQQLSIWVGQTNAGDGANSRPTWYPYPGSNGYCL